MSAPFLILLAVFIGLTLARVPIAFGLLLAALAYLVAAGRDIGLAADQIMNTLVNNYLLVAIPLFLLAANLMNAGSISDRLFAACHVLVGRVRGGLAQVDVLVSVLFASMSGSAVADAAGPGVVTIRAMDRAGYPRGFAAAIVAASSVLGPIIPPSIPMILYALMANASVAALFLGGVVPGLLIAAAMMLVVWITARRRNFPVEAPAPRSERWKILGRAVLPLGMPVVLLGGIYSGAFTPTEAAAVAALYALLLGAAVYRELGAGNLFTAFADTARQSAVILLMICGAFAVNYAVTAEQLDKALAAWIGGMGLSPLAFLLLVNVVFLALGCFIDATTMLLVLVPVLLPTVAKLGIDPVYFGVVIVFNITIGLVTPPYGLLLFVLAALTRIPLREIIRESWGLIGSLVAALALMVAFPGLVMWLPRVLGYVR
ncbi:MAG TPA: TRAP transporter large permease [Burkholderiales bacterium]|nr:TRAP transporter large permease [Burkholderiales bacterium]